MKVIDVATDLNQEVALELGRWIDVDLEGAVAEQSVDQVLAGFAIVKPFVAAEVELAWTVVSDISNINALAVSVIRVWAKFATVLS